MRGDTRWTRTGVVLALVFAVAGCHRATVDDDLVERELLRIKAWTVPAGASVRNDVGLSHRGQHAAASCQFATSMAWPRYRAWLEEKRRTDYQETEVADGHVSFSRTLPGDRFTVEIAAIMVGPPLEVRVSFVSHAD
jgi:hypothetical protein